MMASVRRVVIASSVLLMGLAVPRAADAGCRDLMVSLEVVVLNVLSREEAQVAGAERDHSIETFLFDRPNEPFGVRLRLGPASTTSAMRGCSCPSIVGLCKSEQPKARAETRVLRQNDSFASGRISEACGGANAWRTGQTIRLSSCELNHPATRRPHCEALQTKRRRASSAAWGTTARLTTVRRSRTCAPRLHRIRRHPTSVSFLASAS